MTSAIEVICGGREATKEELEEWKKIEQKFKEQERPDWQQAVMRTFLAGH